MGCAQSKEVIKIEKNNKINSDFFDEGNEINNEIFQRGKKNYTMNKYSNSKNNEEINGNEYLNKEENYESNKNNIKNNENEDNNLTINIDEINSNYIILDKIHKNEISIDYKIQSKKNRNLFQILKVIEKNKIGKSIPEEKIISEIKMLKSLKNEKIIQVYDCFYDNKNYYIITELCELGNLNSLMKKTKKFSENQTKYIIFQILKAVKYLSEKNFVHTDIKPTNIYINKIFKYKDEKIYKVKLLDFASGNNYNNSKIYNSNLPYYISPEIFENNFNYKCDIWSIGVIFYQMIFGYTPFNGYNYNDLVFNIKYSYINFDYNLISENALNLLQNMLVRNIESRFDSEQCLNHIWFKNINDFEKGENSINDGVHNSIKIKKKERKSSFSKNKKNYKTSGFEISQRERENHINNKIFQIKKLCKNIILDFKDLKIKKTLSLNNNEIKIVDLENHFINQNIKYIHHYIRKKFFYNEEMNNLKKFFDKYKNNDLISFENTIFSFKKYCGIDNNLVNDFLFNEKIIKKLNNKYKKSDLNIKEFQNFLIEFKGEIIEEYLYKIFSNFNGNNKRELMNSLNKNQFLKYKKYFIEINKEMKEEKLKENYLFFEYKALLEKIINRLNSQ